MSNYSESHFLRLQDYIAEGSKATLSVEESDYMDLLYATVGMIRKYGRQNTVSWLIKEKECSHFVAHRIYEETVNLFYTDDKVTQNAWRNLLFQKLMDVAHQMETLYFMPLDEKDEIDTPDGEETGAKRKMFGAKEIEAYTKLLGQAAKIKRLDQQDPMPRTAIQNNQVNYYGSNPRDAQMPDTDKQAIASVVEEYLKQKGIKKSVKDGLLMDLGMKPADIDTILDRSVDIAQEVEE